MMKRFFTLMAASIVFAAMAGCSGGGSGNTNAPNSVGAAPTLGVVRNAQVIFFQNDGITQLGTGNSGDDGIIQINVPGTYDGPVVIQVNGGGNAIYFDESTLTDQPFPAGSSMFGLAPSPQGVVAITALTSIAYDQAVAQGFVGPGSGSTITANAVNSINNIVRQSLAPGLNSILSVPTNFTANTTQGSLGNSEADAYAIILAALARLGAGQANPAVAVLNALREDAGDGQIDGMNNGAPLSTPAPYNNFQQQQADAIADVANDFGNADAQANAGNNAPNDTNVDSGNVDNTDDDTGTGGTGGSGGSGGGGI